MAALTPWRHCFRSCTASSSGWPTAHMRQERPDHTLGTTGLVHEAYLRLVDSASIDWQGRAHFFGVASRAMRRILVDHARRRTAHKRSRQQGVSLDEGAAGAVELPADEVLAVDEALERFARLDPRAAQLVELRYFAGLQHRGGGRAAVHLPGDGKAGLGAGTGVAGKGAGVMDQARWQRVKDLFGELEGAPVRCARRDPGRRARRRCASRSGSAPAGPRERRQPLRGASGARRRAARLRRRAGPANRRVRSGARDRAGRDGRGVRGPASGRRIRQAGGAQDGGVGPQRRRGAPVPPGAADPGPARPSQHRGAARRRREPERHAVLRDGVRGR